MLQFISSLVGKLRSNDPSSEKLPCFHCAELVKRKHAIVVEFDGAKRITCCHGCASILKTVEQMGMLAQYQAEKLRATKSNEE